MGSGLKNKKNRKTLIHSIGILELNESNLSQLLF